MVTANPLIIILVLSIVGVDLLTELTIQIVIVVVIAILAEEAVLVLLHPRTNLLEYLLRQYVIDDNDRVTKL